MIAVRLSHTALAAFLAMAHPALAQVEPLGSAAGPAGGDGSCDTKAALYATDKGFKIWVTRRGMMTQENPLRPLSPETKVVLEVAVNGRLATAHGSDFASLQRSGPPQELELTSLGPIRWEPGLNGMPSTLRVVAEDGSLVLGPLRFASCGEAPKIAPVSAKRPARKAAPKSGSGTESAAPPGLVLPQGAIP
jgi:hypothetical protein